MSRLKDMDILKDLLQNRMTNQINYNQQLISIRNPEMRQVYTQLRDDEARDIVLLQQKIQQLSGSTGIIARIFSEKTPYDRY